MLPNHCRLFLFAEIINKVITAFLISLAITHLSGVKVYGKEIKVTSSKHNSVSMPKDGDVSVCIKD